MIQVVFGLASAVKLTGIMFVVLLMSIQRQHWDVHLSLNVLHHVICRLQSIVFRVSEVIVLRLIAKTFQASLILFAWDSLLAKSLSWMLYVGIFYVVLVFGEMILPLAQLSFFHAQLFYLFRQILFCKQKVMFSFVAELYNIFIACNSLEQCLVFQLVLFLHDSQLFLFGLEDLLISQILFQFLAFDSKRLILSVHAVDNLLAGLVIGGQLRQTLQGFFQSVFYFQINTHYLLFQIKDSLLEDLILFLQFGLFFCHIHSFFLDRVEFDFEQLTTRTCLRCRMLLLCFFSKGLILQVTNHLIQLSNQLVSQFNSLLQFIQLTLVTHLPQLLHLFHFKAQSKQLCLPALLLLSKIPLLLPHQINQFKVITFELTEITNQSRKQYLTQPFFKGSTLRLNFCYCLSAISHFFLEVVMLYNNYVGLFAICSLLDRKQAFSCVWL